MRNPGFGITLDDVQLYNRRTVAASPEGRHWEEYARRLMEEAYDSEDFQILGSVPHGTLRMNSGI